MRRHLHPAFMIPLATLLLAACPADPVQPIGMDGFELPERGDWMRDGDTGEADAAETSIKDVTPDAGDKGPDNGDADGASSNDTDLGDGDIGPEDIEVEDTGWDDEGLIGPDADADIATDSDETDIMSDAIEETSDISDADIADTPPPETCIPGSLVACIGGLATWCADAGSPADPVVCLGGCGDGPSGCAPLAGAERGIPTGEGPEDAPKRFAIARRESDGALLMAWTRTMDTPVYMMFMDVDGNIWPPGIVSLPGSTGLDPTRLGVTYEPTGGAIMAVAAGTSGSSSTATIWTVAPGSAAMTSAGVAVLTEAQPMVLPSLTTVGSDIAVFHIGTGPGGGEVVTRTRWPAGGGTLIMEVVDPLEIERWDVMAVRTTSASAHIFESLDGGVRAGISTVATPGGTLSGFGGGDHLFADALAGDAVSALVTLQFTDDGETFEVRIFGNDPETDWVSVADAATTNWVELAWAGGTLHAVHQSSSGALGFADTDLTSATAIGIPPAGGERPSFDLIGGVSATNLRLITLGRNTPTQPNRLRISLIEPAK